MFVSSKLTPIVFYNPKSFIPNQIKPSQTSMYIHSPAKRKKTKK